MKLTIDYCTECGYLDRALEAAESILENYCGEFDKVELVPAEGGVLRISIESEIVFDIDKNDFSMDEIKEGIEEYLEKE